MRWLAILNPGAGGSTDVAEPVRQAFEREGIDAHLAVSESPEHIADLIAEAETGSFDGVIAVGGDGTVSLVVDALLKRRPVEPPLLGIVPAGSGCDFVRVFGIPQDIDGAVAHLSGNTTYLTDAGVIEGSWGTRYFMNAADLGLLGATVKRANRLPRFFGERRYLAAFWTVLPFFARTRIRVEMEQRQFDGRAIATVLANGQFFGGGINIAPKASLVDGVFDVQVFTGSRLRYLAIVPKARRGLHLNHPTLRRFRSGTLTITAERSWPVEVDGDYLGETPVTVRTVPGAIRIKI